MSRPDVDALGEVKVDLICRSDAAQKVYPLRRHNHALPFVQAG